MPQPVKETQINEICWVSSQNTQNFQLADKIPHKPKEISFWNDIPMFHSENTNIEEPLNKFVIEKIEILNSKKILHGKFQKAIITGLFSETQFKIGQKVTIVPCICCKKIKMLEKDESFSYEELIFDSSDLINDSNKTIFLINDTNNIILIEDDILTATSFCSALKCINYPLIQSLIADLSFQFANPCLINGILTHTLIQSALMEKKTTFTFLINKLKNIIKDNLLLIYSCNISDRIAENSVIKNIKNILSFLDKNFQVKKVEHKVLSTLLSLKGSIDCLGSDFIIEIKTGKTLSLEHRSQAILYSLLMMENNDSSVYKTYLYYVQSDNIIDIDIKHEEIINLLKIRNDIACNKSLISCDCPEGSICYVINSIKKLPESHFLRKQYEAIEFEATREKTYFEATKISQNNEKLWLKTVEHIATNEYIYIYSINHKYITLGVLDSYEKDNIVIILRESINLDKNLFISLDNDTHFLKYMRWSLVNIAYQQYQKGSFKGFGIDSFLLPGQEYGFEISSCIEENEDQCSLKSDDLFELSDDIEFNSLDGNLSDDLKFNSLDIDPDFSSNSCKNNDINLERKQNDKLVNTEPYLQSSCSQQTTNTFKTKFFDSIFSTDVENIRCEDISDLENITNTNNKVSKINNDGSKVNHINKINDNKDINKVNDNKDINKANHINADKTSTINKDSNKVNKINDNKDNKPSKIINDNNKHIVDCSQISNNIKSSTPTVLFNEISANSDHSPYFDIPSSRDAFKNYKYSIPEIFRNEFLKLNDEQKQALFLSLNCPNYKIIHGMPGTGKSTVISLLIKILIFYQKKVLLVCFTHLAIQNILSKIGKVKCYRAKKEFLKFNNSQELNQYFKNIELVAGTCYSFNDPVYLNRKFDYCVIDEGSQMHLLLSLIPISISERFCIVGDHLQLSPLCKKSQELKTSLFQYLINNCSILNHQYRMGDSIMRLSNTLFYNNALIGFGGISNVVFYDSNKIDFIGIIKNAKNCVILCYFNSKVRELSAINKDITITTIDRFQGSENDEVIVVFDPIERCEVLENPERLNVALTRARKRLILIGNKERMVKIPLFKQLIDLIL